MTDGDTAAPLLVLGPLLRYVGETEATIWVETDRACEVKILGRQARTFEVSGHHYALVVIGDLQPGAEYEQGGCGIAICHERFLPIMVNTMLTASAATRTAMLTRAAAL